MAARRFNRIQTTNVDVNRLQDSVKETLDPITSNLLLGGNLLKAVNLVAGPNLLSHGLGRNYLAWMLLRPSSAATLFETPSPDPSKYIQLTASAPLTCSLLVF